MRKFSLAACALLLLFIGYTVDAFGQSGWYPLHVPGGYQYLDVANDSELAVFQGGSVSISHDGGLAWHQSVLFHHSDSDRFNALKFLSHDTLILFGRQLVNGYPQYETIGLIDSSFDDGSSWKFTGTGIRNSDFEFDIVGHTTPRWIYGFNDYDAGLGLLHGWDGRSGRLLWDSYNPTMQNMQFSDDSTGMVIASEANRPFEKLFFSKNGGKHWLESSLILKRNAPTVPAVHPGPFGSWLVSNDSDLILSRDTGRTWSIIQSFDRGITEFQFFDSVGYVVLNGADYIMKTSDAGKTWFAQSCYNGRDPVSYVVPTSKTVAYAWSEGNSADDIMRVSGSLDAPVAVLSAQRTLSFGALPHDSIATRSITIRNVGAAQLTVSGWVADGANLQIFPNSFSIAPTDSFPITVSYSTRNGAGDDIRFRLLANTAPKEEIFHVFGSALLPALRYSSHSIDFGTVKIGERQTKKIRITNIGKTTAKFIDRRSTSFLFNSTALDSIEPGKSEVVSVRFSPELALGYDAKLVISSNFLIPDTINLHGSGVMDRSKGIRVGWEKSHADADTLPGIATNIVISGASKVLVQGVDALSDSLRETFISVYGSSGDALSALALHSGALEDGTLSAGVVDASGGGYFAFTPFPGALGLAHIGSAGTLIWSDTLLPKNTAGVDPKFIVGLASNSSGDCGLLCSGFAHGSEPSQILYRKYQPNGVVSQSNTINGNATYTSSQGMIEHSAGLDFGTAIVGSDSGFFGALAIDHGYVYNGYIPFHRTLDNEVWSFGTSIGNISPSRQDKYSSGLLVLKDGKLVEAGRYLDSGYYLKWFGLAGDSLGQQLIPPATGIDSLYGFEADSLGDLYLIATTPTDLAAKDVMILHYSPDGKLLWQQTFDGLGSADDIPIKLLINHGFAYVLVKSADTNGNDWILLKYDSTGRQLFRLRYDGAGHGDDVPRDFAIGGDGAIYVVGGSTNVKGVEQFTVVKYIDSALAAVRPTEATITMRLDAQLSENPWSGSTTLSIIKPATSLVTIRIFDLLGREYFNLATHTNAIHLDRSQFPTGFYTISIEDDSGVRKLLKFVRE